MWIRHGSSPIVLGSCLNTMILKGMAVHSDDVRWPVGMPYMQHKLLVLKPVFQSIIGT